MMQAAHELKQVNLVANHTVRVLTGSMQGQEGTVMAIYDDNPLVKIGGDIKSMEMRELGRLVHVS